MYSRFNLEIAKHRNNPKLHKVQSQFPNIGLILSQFEEAGVRGREQCCTIILLHMSRLNTTESAIFVFFFGVFLASRGHHSELFDLH